MTMKTLVQTETFTDSKPPKTETILQKTLEIDERTWFTLFFSLTSTLHHTIFPLQIWAFGNKGYIIGLVINVIFYLVNILTSNSFKYNTETAKRNGYSNALVYSYYTFNMMIWHLPFYLLLWAFAPYDPSLIRLDYLIFVELAISLIATDVMFFFVHRGLHRHLSWLHALHHCAKYSSFTTNLFIHPVDLVIELGTPVLLATFLYVKIFQDTFGMVVAYSFFFDLVRIRS